jgi:hypothetical protein
VEAKENLIKEKLNLNSTCLSLWPTKGTSTTSKASNPQSAEDISPKRKVFRLALTEIQL